MQYLKTLDYILFVLLMIGGIWGAIKGFIDEVSAKAGYVFGFIFALMFTHSLSPVFVDRLGFPLWLGAFLAYFSIFIVAYLVMMVFGSILSNIVDTANLNVVDNVLGFVLGLAEMFLVLAALEYILGNQYLVNVRPLFDESLFSSRIITPFTDWFFGFISHIGH